MALPPKRRRNDIGYKWAEVDGVAVIGGVDVVWKEDDGDPVVEVDDDRGAGVTGVSVGWGAK